jgi:hypothetical protein
MMQLGDFLQRKPTEEKIDQLIVDCKEGKEYIICQKKILLDKKNRKTYEVYRQTAVMRQ